MNCPRCGKRAAQRARFCPDCGTPIEKLEPVFTEALKLFNRGQYLDAATRLHEASRAQAPSSKLEAWRGHALFFAGREDDARASYNAALALDPDAWDALHQLASSDFAAGRHAQAAAGFALVARTQPSLEGHPLAPLFGGEPQRVLAQSHLYRALALRELQQLDEANTEIKASIQLDPKNPLAYGVQGDLLSSSQDYLGAAKAFEGALALAPDEISRNALRNDLGVAYFRAGDLTRAAEVFKTLLLADPGNENALHNLGVLYMKQGVGQELERDMRDFLRADDAEKLLLGLTRSIARAARADTQELDRAGILGDSAGIREVLDTVLRAAASDSTVLVLGESGTGKELVARAIHRNSPRRDKPFIAVNCAAIPETLLESELFGYERGAFTGAVTAKPGRFEMAEGGTIFLDEIGDLQASIQVKLLRVLQERSFERLGGNRTQHVNIRIITATHRDLRRKMVAGEFREDLFYRLFVVPIQIPPLRQRASDIPILARNFLARFSARFKRRFRDISPQALEALRQWPWPGNVRELENVIERAAAMNDAELLIPAHLHFDRVAPATSGTGVVVEGLGPLEQVERQQIVRQLRASRRKVVDAAKALGLSRATLYRKIERLKISIENLENETDSL